MRSSNGSVGFPSRGVPYVLASLLEIIDASGCGEPGILGHVGIGSPMWYLPFIGKRMVHWIGRALRGSASIRPPVEVFWPHEAFLPDPARAWGQT